MDTYTVLIRDFMADGRWYTVLEVAAGVGCHPGTAWRTLRLFPRRRTHELPYHPFVYRSPRAGLGEGVVPGG